MMNIPTGTVKEVGDCCECDECVLQLGHKEQFYGPVQHRHSSHRDTHGDASSGTDIVH